MPTFNVYSIVSHRRRWVVEAETAEEATEKYRTNAGVDGRGQRGELEGPDGRGGGEVELDMGYESDSEMDEDSSGELEVVAAEDDPEDDEHGNDA